MRDRADAAGPVDFPSPGLGHAGAILDHDRIVGALEIAFHGARLKVGVTRFARFTIAGSPKVELSGTITIQTNAALTKQEPRELFRRRAEIPAPRRNRSWPYQLRLHASEHYARVA